MVVGGMGTGTLRGLVYTNHRIPYTSDLIDTKNVPEVVIHARGKITRIREPISGYGVYAEWNSNAIGDIAERQGLQTVYYADMEIFSILGIWKDTKLHIYGE